MNSSELIERGKAVLATVAGQKAVDELDWSEAYDIWIRNKENILPVEQLIADPQNYIMYMDYIPRSSSLADGYKKASSFFFDQSNVSAFICDKEDDPHLKRDLFGIRECIREAGANPDNAVTTTYYKPKHLIVIGTGSGHQLIKLVHDLNPNLLTIVVDNWNDFASSFYTLDWIELWNSYCLDDSKIISAIKGDDATGIASFLFDKFNTLLDHSLCILLNNSTSLQRLHSGLTDTPLFNRALSYTGFIIDEYNMLYNSWETISNSPKIFDSSCKIFEEHSVPAIVCGSGPSLDNSIQEIKRLSINHLIVACASNYGTLRKHDIRVDVLCLLERGEFMIDQYLEVQQLYPNSGAYLCMSVTSPYEISNHFRDTVVYFRPLLTPLSIFAESESQILNYEGPQTINTGVAFCFALGIKDIKLVGVDLGTKDPQRPRSVSAIGESPREFDIKVKANNGELAFTNEMLLDGARILEGMAKYGFDADSRLYNASDGIYIDGWQPLNLAMLNVDNSSIRLHNALAALESWYEEMPIYDLARFKAHWKASRIRENTHELFRKLFSVISSKTNWYPDVLIQVNKLLRLDDKPAKHQVAIRITRGHILKLVIAIQREIIVLSGDPISLERFEKLARDYLVKSLNEIQNEIYALYDLLESRL